MGFDFGLNRTKWAGMNHEMSVYLQSLLEKKQLHLVSLYKIKVTQVILVQHQNLSDMQQL